MKIKRHANQAFSLVEVVIALAIVVVAGFGLVGLLSTGLQATHDSKEQLQAANIAEYISTVRRAAPTNDFSGTNTAINPQSGFPFPALGSATNNIYSSPTGAPTPTYLTWDGLTTTSGTNAAFAMLFNVVPSTNYPTTSPGAASVYLCIYWPPAAQPNPSSGRFEMNSTFYLP